MRSATERGNQKTTNTILQGQAGPSISTSQTKISMSMARRIKVWCSKQVQATSYPLVPARCSGPTRRSTAAFHDGPSRAAADLALPPAEAEASLPDLAMRPTVKCERRARAHVIAATSPSGAVSTYGAVATWVV